MFTLHSDALTVAAAPRKQNGILLIDVCQQRSLPYNLDRSLKTRENGRTRSTFEDRNMLISIVNRSADDRGENGHRQRGRIER